MFCYGAILEILMVDNGGGGRGGWLVIEQCFGCRHIKYVCMFGLRFATIVCSILHLPPPLPPAPSLFCRLYPLTTINAMRHKPNAIVFAK